MEPSILLLTGPSGAGKTTVCLRLASLARESGLAVAGVITRPVEPVATTEGAASRDVVDAATGARRPLARQGGPADDPNGGPRLGAWRFSAGGLAWGAALLGAAGPCDLLIVDEIGPLELVRGEGWTVALDALRWRRYRLAVVVVRPELVGSLQERLAGLPVETAAVTTESRDALAGAIVSRLGGRP